MAIVLLGLSFMRRFSPAGLRKSGIAILTRCPLRQVNAMTRQILDALPKEDCGESPDPESRLDLVEVPTA
jgi:hypothetical protein